MRFALLLAAGLPLAAQTFVLGTASDPCTGGVAYSAASPAAIPTLRFGAPPFSCTFSVGGPGAYLVELDFVEPTVTSPGGRVFNVALTDAWGIEQYGALTNVDLVTMGAVSPAVVIARTFLVFSQDGKIMVSLSTVLRSALISRVVITPIQLGPLMLSGTPGTAAIATRQPGVSGLDLITFALPDGTKRYEVGAAIYQSWLAPSLMPWASPAPIASIPAPISGK